MAAGLPEPKVVENINYANEYTNLKQEFQELKPEYTGFQDSDVVMIVLQLFAALVIDILTKINAAASSVLILLASGSFLDQLGVFWSVTRRVVVEAQPKAVPPVAEVLETDDAFRARILLAIDSFTKGATEEYYEFNAIQADPLVDSAKVYKVGVNNSKVYIAIKSTDNNGVPSSLLLSTVQTYMDARNIRSINDSIVVTSAAGATLNVTAELTLLPNAPSTVLTDLADSLELELSKINDLGRDITLSWIISKLSGDYVYSVNLIAPTTNLVVEPNQFAKIGTITLTEASERLY